MKITHSSAFVWMQQQGRTRRVFAFHTASQKGIKLSIPNASLSSGHHQLVVDFSFDMAAANLFTEEAQSEGLSGLSQSK